MRTDIIDYLIGLAKKGETVNLPQLCNDCKLKLDVDKEEDKAYILNILDEITFFDQKMGRPLLASLVFDYNQGIPENNYFAAAEKLGLFSLDLKSERKLEFHINQLERVFKFWDSPKSDLIKKSRFTPLMNDFLSAFKSRYSRKASRPYYLTDL